jgi:hypothetical protein
LAQEYEQQCEELLRIGNGKFAMVSQGSVETRKTSIYEVEEWMDYTGISTIRTLRYRKVMELDKVKFPVRLSSCWGNKKCGCKKGHSYLKSINFQVVQRAINRGMVFVPRNGELG